jgi:hypothetical protein
MKMWKSVRRTAAARLRVATARAAFVWFSAD